MKGKLWCTLKGSRDVWPKGRQAGGGYLMPTETGLVRLRVASLPRLACRVADSSTVWRLRLRDSSVRLSKIAMISPANTPQPHQTTTERQKEGDRKSNMLLGVMQEKLMFYQRPL